MDLVRKGKAMDKMREIIGAQGGDPKVKIGDLPIGKYLYAVKAEKGGRVSHVDNKSVSRIARAAGAPKDKGAGIILHCEMGDRINVGDTLFEIISDSETKLSFAIETANALPPVELQKVIIGKVE
jgi:AMP phosphorylase